MYILDTDHLGILQRQRGPEYDRLAHRLATVSASDVFVTIISFHEQIRRIHRLGTSYDRATHFQASRDWSRRVGCHRHDGDRCFFS